MSAALPVLSFWFSTGAAAMTSLLVVSISVGDVVSCDVEATSGLKNTEMSRIFKKYVGIYYICIYLVYI